MRPHQAEMVLDIAQTVNQRIRFQEEKRQRNLVAVVHQAAEELGNGDKEVPNEPTDHDWTARFFDDVQDVSSPEMQLLWAKVLAGEVEKPGNTSIRTLSILRNLDQRTANLFRTLCSVCMLLKLGGSQFIDARVPSLGGNAGSNALQAYGLGFDSLNVLNEYGLITSDYNSWRDYGICIGTVLPNPNPQVLRIPFMFQNQCWILLPTGKYTIGQEFRLEGVALTRSGRELSQVVSLEAMPQYTQDLMKFFESNHLQMTQVENSQPQVFQANA